MSLVLHHKRQQFCDLRKRSLSCFTCVQLQTGHAILVSSVKLIPLSADRPACNWTNEHYMCEQRALVSRTKRHVLCIELCMSVCCCSLTDKSAKQRTHVRNSEIKAWNSANFTRQWSKRQRLLWVKFCFHSSALSDVSVWNKKSRCLFRVNCGCLFLLQVQLWQSLCSEKTAKHDPNKNQVLPSQKTQAYLLSCACVWGAMRARDLLCEVPSGQTPGGCAV